MYQRIAYFVGAPNDTGFDEALKRVFTGFRALPGLQHADLGFAEERDVNAIDLYATVQLTFDSIDTLNLALATPARQLLREQFVTQVLPLFSGEVFHINQRLN